MTGMAAATFMLDGKVGVLRTMPAPDGSFARFRRRVDALGVPWERVREVHTLDPSKTRRLAGDSVRQHQLFRGAGYTGGRAQQGSTTQAAVGAPGAHATAPLRRVVDRFVLVTCEALSLGRDVPKWVRDGVTLTHLMEESDGEANRLEAQSLNAIEAALLSSRICDEFDAAVGADEGGWRRSSSSSDPVVAAFMEGSARGGARVRAE